READDHAIGMDELRGNRRREAVAHRARPRARLRSELRELGEAVRPDGEVAGAARLHRVARQSLPQELHDRAEVEVALHRPVDEARLALRPRARRPLPPAWL